MAAISASVLNLGKLAELDMNETIPYETLVKALSSPPFKQIPGGFNIRDIGQVGNGAYIRPGLIYRSGSLAFLTEEGKQLLVSELGIEVILDLRSESEAKAHPEPKIPGVKTIFLPREKDPKPFDLSLYHGPMGGDPGYVSLYLDILDIYAPSFRHVLQYLKDEATKDKAILFHCTAGKDRTGVLAALILSLAGVPEETIAEDYALTRIGIETQKDFLSGMIKKWQPTWTEDTPGVKALLAIRPSYILAFLESARKEYGGIEGYVQSRLKFSPAEIEKIKASIRP